MVMKLQITGSRLLKKTVLSPKKKKKQLLPLKTSSLEKDSLNVLRQQIQELQETVKFLENENIAAESRFLQLENQVSMLSEQHE